jgi:hypothetical protein
VAEPPDKPPIIFVSQFGQPGDYDPLARKAAEDTQPIRRAKSLAAGMPPAPSREATGANAHGSADPDPHDDGDDELVRC